jgi:hypothetical protein
MKLIGAFGRFFLVSISPSTPEVYATRLKIHPVPGQLQDRRGTGGRVHAKSDEQRQVPELRASCGTDHPRGLVA